MRNQDLGFDMEKVLVVKAPRVRDASFEKKFETWKNTLLTYPGIRKMSVVTEVPGRQIYWDAGAIRKAGEDIRKGKNYMIVGIDYDFVEFFDIDLVWGRSFSKEFPADKDTLMLNETAVKWMGFESPEAAVGQRVDYWEKIFTIIGVVGDYHQQSLKEAFEPQIFRLMPYGRGPRGVFALKTGPQSTQETIRLVRERYEEFFPGNPFQYFFLNDYYDEQYQADRLLGSVLGLFSFLAIFVTSLGILGLSSFMATERTKEIGIRKVLGAGVAQILFLLTKEFLVLILLSFLLAFPLCYWGINRWLGLFANKMSLGPWLFLAPLGIVWLITFLTISTHVMKSALANPVEALRYE
jgi:putative ABC transport system permease protein